MHDLLSFLEKTYPLTVQTLTPAPRGLVAQTFFATTAQQRLFVKIIHAPLFKAHLRHSAATHAYLATQLGDRINHPLQTRDGVWVAPYGSALVSVSTGIEAPASEAYDTYAFGQLIGRLHTVPVDATIPTRVIGDFAHVALCDTQAAHAFAGTGANPRIRALAPHLAPWQSQYAHYRARRTAFAQLLRNQPPQPLVYTHGDAGGNVLAATPTDLHIIDWDYVGLSEPERDLWVFEHDERFIAGYRSVVPAYQPDETRLQYAAYRQFFDYFAYILDMISRAPDDTSAAEATANLLSLFTDWCPPHLR